MKLNRWFLVAASSATAFAQEGPSRKGRLPGGLSWLWLLFVLLGKTAHAEVCWTEYTYVAAYVCSGSSYNQVQCEFQGWDVYGSQRCEYGGIEVQPPPDVCPWTSDVQITEVEPGNDLSEAHIRGWATAAPSYADLYLVVDGGAAGTFFGTGQFDMPVALGQLSGGQTSFRFRTYAPPSCWGSSEAQSEESVVITRADATTPVETDTKQFSITGPGNISRLATVELSASVSYSRFGASVGGLSVAQVTSYPVTVWMRDGAGYTLERVLAATKGSWEFQPNWRDMETQGVDVVQFMSGWGWGWGGVWINGPGSLSAGIASLSFGLNGVRYDGTVVNDYAAVVVPF